jgi:hypothetical protein
VKLDDWMIKYGVLEKAGDGMTEDTIAQCTQRALRIRVKKHGIECFGQE